MQVALLHDTIEATETGFQPIINGFGEKLALGVQALPKTNSISAKKVKMMDSLNRINDLDKEVGMVKLADRISNLPLIHSKRTS